MYKLSYGHTAEKGLFRCTDCGYMYYHDSEKELPCCPKLEFEAHPTKKWLSLSSTPPKPQERPTLRLKRPKLEESNC